MLWSQGNSEISHTVGTRQKPGQDRRMGRVGNRTVRESVLEANAIQRQGIKRRGFNLLVSIAGNVVRAKRIDGDEKHVGARGPRSRSLFSGRNARAQDQ